MFVDSNDISNFILYINMINKIIIRFLWIYHQIFTWLLSLLIDVMLQVVFFINTNFDHSYKLSTYTKLLLVVFIGNAVQISSRRKAFGRCLPQFMKDLLLCQGILMVETSACMEDIKGSKYPTNAKCLWERDLDGVVTSAHRFGTM